MIQTENRILALVCEVLKFKYSCAESCLGFFGRPNREPCPLLIFEHVGYRNFILYPDYAAFYNQLFIVPGLQFNAISLRSLRVILPRISERVWSWEAKSILRFSSEKILLSWRTKLTGRLDMTRARVHIRLHEIHRDNNWDCRGK